MPGVSAVKLILLQDIVERLGAIVGIPESSIINALVDVAWDRQEADKLETMIEDSWEAALESFKAYVDTQGH
jgi:hypothetical protein